MSKPIQQGAIGASIALDLVDQDGEIVVVSLAVTTTRQMVLFPPTGPERVFDAVPITDGSDGGLEYITTSSDDLDQVGRWYRQARVTFTDGTYFPSAVVPFEVARNGR